MCTPIVFTSFAVYESSSNGACQKTLSRCVEKPCKIVSLLLLKKMNIKRLNMETRPGQNDQRWLSVERFLAKVGDNAMNSTKT